LFSSENTALQSYTPIFQNFTLCVDVMQQSFIQHDFFSSLIWGYLLTKFPIYMPIRTFGLWAKNPPTRKYYRKSPSVLIGIKGKKNIRSNPPSRKYYQKLTQRHDE